MGNGAYPFAQFSGDNKEDPEVYKTWAFNISVFCQQPRSGVGGKAHEVFNFKKREDTLDAELDAIVFAVVFGSLTGRAADKIRKNVPVGKGRQALVYLAKEYDSATAVEHMTICKEYSNIPFTHEPEEYMRVLDLCLDRAVSANMNYSSYKGFPVGFLLGNVKLALAAQHGAYDKFLDNVHGKDVGWQEFFVLLETHTKQMQAMALVSSNPDALGMAVFQPKARIGVPSAHVAKQTKQGAPKQGVANGAMKKGSKQTCPKCSKPGHGLDGCYVLYPHLKVERDRQWKAAQAQRTKEQAKANAAFILEEEIPISKFVVCSAVEMVREDVREHNDISIIGSSRSVFSALGDVHEHGVSNMARSHRNYIGGGVDSEPFSVGLGHAAALPICVAMSPPADLCTPMSLIALEDVLEAASLV